MSNQRPALLPGLDSDVHSVPVFIGPWPGGLMIFPGCGPAVGCRLVFIELLQHRRGAENGVDQVQHRPTGAPRYIQRNGVKLPRGTGLVPGLDAVEKRRITASPLVYRLLGVSDAKERSLSLRILHHLINEILHHAPLHRAGVLKFIEQPVVERAVESVFDVELIWATSTQYRLAFVRRKQHRQIGKRQPPRSTHLGVVHFLICRKQTMNAFRAGESRFQFPRHAMPENPREFPAKRFCGVIDFPVKGQFPISVLHFIQPCNRTIKND